MVVVREERRAGSPMWKGAKCGKVPNVERRVQVPFWEGRETGFPMACSSYGGAEDRPCCRGKGGMCI